MKLLLTLLVLPPLVLLLPWTVPWWRGQRRRAAWMLALWLLAWALMLLVAFGPGLLLLALLGVGQLVSTTVSLRE